MAQGILLTDDEIVALAAVVGKPWPIGLPTVDVESAALLSAAARGVRSLTVRGLLATGGDGGFVIDPAISAPIEALASSTVRIGAYVAPAAEPLQFAGASLTAARDGDGWWLDAVTPQGIHGLKMVDREEVLAAIDDIVDATQSGALLAGVEDPSAYVCVIRYGALPEEVCIAPTASDGPSWNRALVTNAMTDSARK